MRVVWILGEIDSNAFAEAVKLAPPGYMRIILLQSNAPLQKILSDNNIAYSIVSLSSVHLNQSDINLAVLADHKRLRPDERLHPLHYLDLFCLNFIHQIICCESIGRSYS